MLNINTVILYPERTNALVIYIDKFNRFYYYHIPLADIHDIVKSFNYNTITTQTGKIRYTHFKTESDINQLIEKDVTQYEEWSELVEQSKQNIVKQTIKDSEIIGICIPTGEEFGIVFFRDSTTSKMTFDEIHALIMDNNLNFIITMREEEEWLSII